MGNIPLPVLPDGYGNFPIYIFMGIVYPILILLMGFYLPGMRIIGS
jgi:hypothetical protein